MFCTNCGKNIREDAKFCQYCGSKTVIAAKGSTAGETVPDYPGSEYTIVYSPDGTGESRVEEISSRTGYQSNESAADGRGYQSGIKSAGGSDRAGFYASQTQPAHGSNPGSPQAAGGYAQAANGPGEYTRDMGAMGSFGSDRSDSEAADMSKVFNSPVLGVAGLKEENPGSEQNAEVKSEKKGSGILIAIIVILILLILLVGFTAFAYIQGLIEF